MRTEMNNPKGGNMGRLIVMVLTVMLGQEALANHCCQPDPCHQPKPKVITRTKVVEKPIIVEKEVLRTIEIPTIVEKEVVKTVEVPKLVTKTVHKKVFKKNRISLLAGSGPTKVSLTPTEVRLERGSVVGAQYQRMITEDLSVGVQAQSNETVLGSVGFDF